MGFLSAMARLDPFASGGLGEQAASTSWPGVVVDLVAGGACIAICVAALALSRRQPARGRRTSALLLAAGFACAGAAWLTALVPSLGGFRAVIVALSAASWFATAVAVWRQVFVGIPAIPGDPSPHVPPALEEEVARRKRAEAHAGDVEQFLVATLASIDVGLIATDAAGNVTRMNAVAERVTGWARTDALGRPYWEVFVREDRPPIEAGRTVVDLLCAQGLVVDTVHRVTAVSRQGLRTPVEVKGALRRLSDGSTAGMLALITDMTGVDRAEEVRRRLAAIVESSHDAIIGKTLDGRIVSWNRAAANLFGYSEAEILGHSVQMLIPPERRAEEMDILANLFDGRVVAPFETVRLAKGGRRIELSVTISPIRDSAGRIIGGSKIARDIGPQRQMVAALRESEARLRFALEVGRIGDWELDLRRGAIGRSLRHDHCFGYESLQPEWSMATLLEHVHPQDRDAVASSFRQGLQGSDDWRSEFRVVWPDQSVHWLSIHGSTRYDTGDSDRMLGIVLDVTEQHQAEDARLHAQRLESENRQILESNRSKTQFLANMSHELRSPLNAIIGFSDLLGSEGVVIAPAEQRQFIGHIATSGRHLLQLINDVLDLSKVESGKFEFFPEPVDLPVLFADVRSVMFSLLRSKHQSLEIAVAPEVAAVVADPARLKQALFNYLSNAIKFSSEGGRIELRATAQGEGGFRIEVQDDGPGIAETDLPLLFVEFQQLDAGYTKRHQGTGLGLALTRRLVQAQGGSVGVRSSLGEGSTFHLVLPRSPTSVIDADDAQPADAAAPSARSVSQVLVIEDDRRGRSLMADALAFGGHHVDVAEDGAQALRQAKAREYDALTLDLMLASPGGLGTLAQIRGVAANAKAPVVAITLGESASGTGGYAIADVLVKPLESSEVITAMTRHGIIGKRGVQVAVIDDDPVSRDLMRVALAELGVEAICFAGGALALEDLGRAGRPAAIVLDLIMPDMDGFEVLERLRAGDDWRDIPVFIWTSMLLSESERHLLAVSASEIVRKGGADLERVLERLRRWQAVGRPDMAQAS
jgi:PAS domain S-box-containing protein